MEIHDSRAKENPLTSLYEEMSTSELFMENESRFSELTVHFQSMILTL